MALRIQVSTLGVARVDLGTLPGLAILGYVPGTRRPWFARLGPPQTPRDFDFGLSRRFASAVGAGPDWMSFRVLESGTYESCSSLGDPFEPTVRCLFSVLPDGTTTLLGTTRDTDLGALRRQLAEHGFAPTEATRATQATEDDATQATPLPARRLTRFPDPEVDQ